MFNFQLNHLCKYKIELFLHDTSKIYRELMINQACAWFILAKPSQTIIRLNIVKVFLYLRVLDLERF